MPQPTIREQSIAARLGVTDGFILYVLRLRLCDYAANFDYGRNRIRRRLRVIVEWLEEDYAGYASARSR